MNWYSFAVHNGIVLLQSASRDPERSPMQWNSDMNAGFNNKTNITWLPIHPDYKTVNVEVTSSLSSTCKSSNTSSLFTFLFITYPLSTAFPLGPDGR